MTETLRPEAVAELDRRYLDDGTPWHDGTVVGVVAVIKVVAKRIGYAVAWHGSLCRDIDLVAVPWTADAVEPEELVRQIMEAIGGAYTHGQKNPSINPHGRLSYAINLHPSATYVDLSVVSLHAARLLEVEAALVLCRDALKTTYGRTEWPATPDCSEEIAYQAACAALAPKVTP